MKCITTLAATVMLISSVLASANDLKTYQDTYEKEMDTIILAHGMQMMGLGEEYTKALDALLTQVKSAGDLNKTTAAMDEIARFRAEKAMPETPPPLLDIQNLQSAYTKQATVYDAEKARKIINLASKYDAALDRLQRSFVASSKLDDAKAVQEERNRALEEESFKHARALLIKAGASGNANEPLPKVADRTFSGIEGTWLISYKNGGWRTVAIDNSGHVQILKYGRGWKHDVSEFDLRYDKSKLRFVSSSNDNGTTETYRLSGNQLIVERWDPGNYPKRQPDNKGTGAREVSEGAW